MVIDVPFSQQTFANQTSGRLDNIFGTCVSVLCGDTTLGVEYHWFIDFDVTGLDLSSLIIGELHIHSTQLLGTSPQNFTVERVTSTWNEGTKCFEDEVSVLTWNNRPTVTNTNFTTFNANSTPNEEYIIDIKNMLQDESSSIFSVRIRITTVESSEGNVISSAVGNFAHLHLESRRFVKTGGSDANNGLSWADAWKTIDKAASTVSDGDEVHIEGGAYNAEPAANDIAPINAGTTGIKYTIWGTAGSGTNDGTGTGTVTVEKNA